MAVYKSIIAYDGTDFRGFQRQANRRRTVQGVLEEALSGLGWRGRSLLSAGRTDAGVHARGQVIAFELEWAHGTERLTKALNARLPADLSVMQCEEAPAGFHPRFSALRRRYRYTIVAAEERDPLLERFAWRVWPGPELGVLQAIAEILLGRQDFGAFGHAPIPGGHTVRQVFRSEWQAREACMAFEIEADAFLQHMVRRLVAAMVITGQGRRGEHGFREALSQPARVWQGPIAPGRGLCLEAVIYAKGRS